MREKGSPVRRAHVSECQIHDLRYARHAAYSDPSPIRVLVVIFVDFSPKIRRRFAPTFTLPFFSYRPVLNENCRVKTDASFSHDGEVLRKHHGLQVRLDTGRSRFLSEISESTQVIGHALRHVRYRNTNIT